METIHPLIALPNICELEPDKTIEGVCQGSHALYQEIRANAYGRVYTPAKVAEILSILEQYKCETTRAATKAHKKYVHEKFSRNRQSKPKRPETPPRVVREKIPFKKKAPAKPKADAPAAPVQPTTHEGTLCPLCKQGTLVRHKGRYGQDDFYGCSNYRTTGCTYKLPIK